VRYKSVEKGEECSKRGKQVHIAPSQAPKNATLWAGFGHTRSLDRNDLDAIIGPKLHRASKAICLHTSNLVEWTGSLPTD
jgi:hypothetical protein